MMLNPGPFNTDFLALLCHERSPLPAAAVVDGAVAIALAVRLTGTDPASRVELFEQSWRAVDLRRAQLHLAGAEASVGVHHVDSLACSSVRAALAASRSILLFPR